MFKLSEKAKGSQKHFLQGFPRRPSLRELHFTPAACLRLRPAALATHLTFPHYNRPRVHVTEMFRLQQIPSVDQNPYVILRCIQITFYIPYLFGHAYLLHLPLNLALTHK